MKSFTPSRVLTISIALQNQSPSLMCAVCGDNAGEVLLSTFCAAWKCFTCFDICSVPALRCADLRGLQGVLQEDGAEERQVRVSGGQELPRGQAEEEPLPVLQVPEVPGRGDGEGGGQNRQPQGEERSSSNEAPGEPGGQPAAAARGADHLAGAGTRGVHAQAGEPGLHSGAPPTTSITRSWCNVHYLCNPALTLAVWTWDSMIQLVVTIT